MVDGKIMEMALEMLNASSVTEANVDAMKLWNSKEWHSAHKAWSDARTCRIKGDKTGAKKKYQEALNGYKKLRDKASKLPNDSFIDSLVSAPTMFITEPRVTAYNAGRGKRNDYFEDKELVRDRTMMEFDINISYIEQEMNSL